ncbi:MAG: Uma2 family endonuclease, partial [Calditrichaeota bacterium]
MTGASNKTASATADRAGEKTVQAGIIAAYSGEFLFFVEGTVEDYYRLEEQKAEFLEEGIVVMHSPASIEHERIFGELHHNLYTVVNQKQLGEVLGSRATVVLGEHRLEPDIVFIGKENPGKFTEMEFSGVPDAVIEIVSKTTREYDLKTKREIYRRHGVKEI